MEFNNLIDVGTTAMHQGGTVVVVALRGGIVEIAYCYLATLLLSNVMYMAVSARFVPGRSLLPGLSLDVIQRNFSFTAHMAIFAILAMIQMEADKVLVSKFLPIALVGFYGVAQTLVARVSRIPGAINQAAYPSFSSLFHRGDKTGLIREYQRLQDLVCYGLIPVFAAIIFASQPLFTYLLSPDAAKILLLPIALLCIGWYMNGTLNTPFTFSMAVGRPDINAKQNLYALFLVLPITGLLVWKWGLVGAGLSSVYYHLFAYSYSARHWAIECMGIAPRAWYLHVLRVLALAAGTYGTVWLALLVLPVDNRSSSGSLAVAYTLATVVYSYLAYVAIGREVRNGFLNRHTRVVGGVLRSGSSD